LGVITISRVFLSAAAEEARKEATNEITWLREKKQKTGSVSAGPTCTVTSSTANLEGRVRMAVIVRVNPLRTRMAEEARKETAEEVAWLRERNREQL